MNAPESGTQLKEYADDLELQRVARGFETAQLIYLTRTGERGSDARATPMRWQGMATIVTRWLDSQPTNESGAETWLAVQYLNYLKEMALADTSPVETELGELVRRFTDARTSLRALHELALEGLEHVGSEGVAWQLSDRSGHRRDGGSINAWPQWWAVFRPVEPSFLPSACDLDFVLGARPDEIDVIGAGLIFRAHRAGGVPNPLEQERWVDHMLSLEFDDGFDGFSPPSRYGGKRLYRRTHLRDLPGGSVEEQAQGLIKFAHSSFAEILRHVPLLEHSAA